jgi:DNA-binding transcriptional MerR regulator
VDRSGLLPIGTLARLSRLSVRAVRLYGSAGLLPPAWVDPDSGYRYYRRDQVRTASAIGLLRSLDVPLAAIGRLLGAGDPEGLRAALEAERDRAQRRLAHARRALRSLERLMAASDLMPYEVGIAEEPATTLAALSRTLDAERLTREVGRMARELQELADSGGWASEGAWCGVYPLDLPDPCPVTLGMPVRDPPAVAGVELVRLPAAPAVATVHVGAYDELPLAYGAIFAWAHERGHELAGPVRETYLDDPAPAGRGERATRVAIPLAHATSSPREEPC